MLNTGHWNQGLRQQFPLGQFSNGLGWGSGAVFGPPPSDQVELAAGLRENEGLRVLSLRRTGMGAGLGGFDMTVRMAGEAVGEDTEHRGR